MLRKNASLAVELICLRFSCDLIKLLVDGKVIFMSFNLVPFALYKYSLLLLQPNRWSNLNNGRLGHAFNCNKWHETL